MRSFALRDAHVYNRLFETYVKPIILYGITVWQPRLKRDRALLQTILNRFERKVAYRCHASHETTAKRNLQDILDTVDLRMFKTITMNCEFSSRMFEVVDTQTRDQCKHRSRFRARNDTVNNFFPWRVTRLVRENSINCIN